MLKLKTLVVILFFVWFSPALTNGQSLPPGFSIVNVGNIYYPTSLAFAPDGRIFCTEKAGIVKIIKNGIVLPTPFLSLNVNQLNERGLSSVAIDPNFISNHFIYVYYTTADTPIHNRLSRFTANGDVVMVGSEVEVLNFEPCVNSIHNGGGMDFGVDGKLYIAVGNDNVNSNSQDLSNYKGKLLRINTDGSIPAGNPFSGSASASRIWAYGFRNPWSIDIQPGTGKIFVDDVGEATWEEINNATAAGLNFGWPGAEGLSSNAAYTNPVYTYHHGATGSDDGCAVTGGAFFNPSSTNYPAGYAGKYFFTDYCNKYINYLDVSGANPVKYNFATGLAGALNCLKVGTDGNIYYYSISQNTLFKIIYSNTNAPTITSQPQSISVPQGQPASFGVSASGALPLSFQWKKGGVNIPGATSATFSISSSILGDAGAYSCSVYNIFGSALSNAANLSVTGFNASPTAKILTPSAGAYYHYGDNISFTGAGSDPEDGVLPASAFQWLIEFHHDAHVHPGPTISPGTTSGSFPTNFGETSANIFFRLILVVSDANNLKDTAFVDIHPFVSNLTIKSNPSGLQFLLDAQPQTTPYSVMAVSGMTRTINATSPQTVGTANYSFQQWSNAGAASQNILLTDHDTIFTAQYATSTISSCAASGTISRDQWNNLSGTLIANIPVNATPSSSSVLTSFEGPSNITDHYGSRIRGYICPPKSGAYSFFIASDDNSELWLSTNELPVNKIRIANVAGYTASREWSKYASQRSGLINLEANRKYYIEALQIDGTQGDNLAVGWQLPDGSMERPIPGNRLSSYVDSGADPLVIITAPSQGTIFSNPANISITAMASSAVGIITKVQFYSNGILLGEDLTAPYLYTWTNATTGSYALKALATTNTGSSASSPAVTISVANCPTPSITANGPLTFCDGSVTLKTTAIQGAFYQWKVNGAAILGATNTTCVANASGDYQVKVVQGSCIAWSAPVSVRKQTTPLSASITPDGATQICQGGSVKLYGNTCSGYSYQWSTNGTTILGATASSYIATLPGSYQLKISYAGSNAWSALCNVTQAQCRVSDNEVPSPPLDVTSLLNTDSEAMLMKLFPNPNNGNFTLEVTIPQEEEGIVSLAVFNLLGQRVFSKKMTAQNNLIQEHIELDKSLATGVYTLQISTGKKSENTRLVLTKQ